MSGFHRCSNHNASCIFLPCCLFGMFDQIWIMHKFHNLCKTVQGLYIMSWSSHIRKFINISISTHLGVSYFFCNQASDHQSRSAPTSSSRRLGDDRAGTTGVELAAFTTAPSGYPRALRLRPSARMAQKGRIVLGVDIPHNKRRRDQVLAKCMAFLLVCVNYTFCVPIVIVWDFDRHFKSSDCYSSFKPRGLSRFSQLTACSWYKKPYQSMTPRLLKEHGRKKKKKKPVEGKKYAGKHHISITAPATKIWMVQGAWQYLPGGRRCCTCFSTCKSAAVWCPKLPYGRNCHQPGIYHLKKKNPNGIDPSGSLNHQATQFFLGAIPRNIKVNVNQWPPGRKWFWIPKLKVSKAATQIPQRSG